MRNWNLFLLIAGILLTLGGIWAFMDPGGTIVALAWLIGIIALASGLFYLFAYFFGKNKAWHRGWILARGILDVLIGVILLWNIAVTTAVLPWVFGFWAIFSGALYISQSLSVRAAGVKSWWWMMIAGILAILVGFAMIANPLVGIFAISFPVGFFLLFFGISAIMAAVTEEPYDVVPDII